MGEPFGRLNYHHLHYFWAVAKDGNLTRTAKNLHVAQSALSMQIKQLEGWLGHPLFRREGRELRLTEVGRIVLEYADTIMRTGNELVSTLRGGQRDERQVLRVGASATLSRNFQRWFLEPVFGKEEVHLVLQSATLDELLPRLQSHSLDIVLTNRSVQEDAENAFRVKRIARQRVSLVGPKRRTRFRFPEDLATEPILLPSRANDVRIAFESICEQLSVRFRVLAEVDDMAMLRVFAKSAKSITLVPPVVVQDELKSGELKEYCAVPNLHEHFYAVTVRRHYERPLVRQMLEHAAKDLTLTTQPGRSVVKRSRKPTSETSR